MRQPGGKVRNGFRTQGRHTVDWDGLDDTGKRAGPCSYFCKLSVDGRAESVIVKLP